MPPIGSAQQLVKSFCRLGPRPESTEEAESKYSRPAGGCRGPNQWSLVPVVMLQNLNGQLVQMATFSHSIAKLPITCKCVSTLASRDMRHLGESRVKPAETCPCSAKVGRVSSWTIYPYIGVMLFALCRHSQSKDLRSLVALLGTGRFRLHCLCLVLSLGAWFLLLLLLLFILLIIFLFLGCLSTLSGLCRLCVFLIFLCTFAMRLLRFRLSSFRTAFDVPRYDPVNTIRYPRKEPNSNAILEKVLRASDVVVQSHIFLGALGKQGHHLTLQVIRAPGETISDEEGQVGTGGANLSS